MVVPKEYPGQSSSTAPDSTSLAQSWQLPADPPMAGTAGTGSVPAPSAGRASDDISVVQRMASATCGSVLTSVLVTPLDVVRVRQQSQSFSSNASSFAHTTRTLKNLPPNLGITACCREVFWIGDNAMCIVNSNTVPIANGAVDCAVEETERRTFTSTLDGLRKIARNEGATTLWRGLSPTMMMGIPANVIYFAGYDWLRSDDRSPIKRVVPDLYAPLIAGSVARIAAATAINPIEMFRTRLQATSGTGTGHFKATLEGLYHMTQAKGYSSLWRGLTLTMWRDVPFSGLYWFGYEKVKQSLVAGRTRAQERLMPHPSSSTDELGSHESNTSTFIDSFVAGATSGSLAALVTTPFDVGKTRQQVFRQMGDDLRASAVGNGPLPGTGIRPEQLSLPQFLMHIFREEGMPGLFRGWVARCLKVAPACAIMISTYEMGKKMARVVNERRYNLDSAEPGA